jgi:hypothetical protein
MGVKLRVKGQTSYRGNFELMLIKETSLVALLPKHETRPTVRLISVLCPWSHDATQNSTTSVLNVIMSTISHALACKNELQLIQVKF